jgi:hypothetical protein
MILLKQKVVFIHISKNAGSSIAESLQTLAAPLPQAIQTSLWQEGPQHSTYQEYAKALGQVASEMTFFAVVRNPWDRLVSLYHYWKASRSSHAHNCTENGTDLSFMPWNGCTFNDWVVLLGSGYCGRHLSPQVDWLVDRHGALGGVGKVLRFETLADSFPETVAAMGLPGLRLKKLNPSNHRNYRDYYNDTSRQIVAARFREDIEVFGYEF